MKNLILLLLVFESSAIFCQNKEDTLMYYKIAKDLYNKEQFDYALRAINKYNFYHPNYDSAYYLKALILEKQECLDIQNIKHEKQAAIYALETVINLNPNFKEAFFKRAFIKFSSFYFESKLEDIYADLDYAIFLDENYVDALFWKVEIENSIFGNKEPSYLLEMVKKYSYVLQINPNYCLALVGRMKCYLDLKKINEACNDYLKIKKIDNCKIDYELECD